MPSMIEYSEVEGCQYEETINSTFRVKNDMDEAELQCVLETVDGEKDKRSVLLNVSTTTSTSRLHFICNNDFIRLVLIYRRLKNRYQFFVKI